MTSIFWFALVVGGGLLGLSLFGGIFGDFFGDLGDGGVEIEVDGVEFGDGADFGSGEVAAEADIGGEGGAGSSTIGIGGSFLMSILSLRSLTYFLFGFGATGLLLDLLWQGDHSLVVLGAALGTGLFSGAINAFLIGYIRRTDSGRLAGDASLIGLIGDVVLPLSRDGTGKIEVRHGARLHTLLARPFEVRPGAGAESGTGTGSGAPPEDWVRVIVAEVEDGVALVIPFDEEEMISGEATMQYLTR